MDSGRKVLHSWTEWPTIRDFRTDRLDGELLPKGAHYVFAVTEDIGGVLESLLTRFSSVQKLFRVTAYIYKWRTSIAPGDRSVCTNVLTVEMLHQSRNL